MSTPGEQWREFIAGDFLEASAAGFAAPFVTGPGAPAGSEPDPAGTVVGRYRLIEEIGRGGMGTVWMAERADGQFEHRVALKLIKRGMDSDEILARFLRERQILARLEHPNIARLLDGGVSEAGRPYFVMELVEGQPITQHCDNHRLSVEARLRLFLRVCQAVHHAHRNLVVHRDLKPSNVLISEAGEVKLLDFGVAKLLDEGASDATQPGRLLTPAYASPEQLSGGSMTTATDVYQLGILLYELLTGRQPFDSGARTRDDPPAPPSAVVGRAATLFHRDGTAQAVLPATVAAARSTTAGTLRRRLRGDLDAIALRALDPKPEQRYPSAEALAQDVERHQAHLPIRYRVGGWRYHTAKFIRRYRAPLAGILLLSGVALGLSATYLTRLRAERDRARLEAAKAAEGAATLRRVFRGWSPDAADRGKVTAELLLSEAVSRARIELANQPELLAATLSMIGDLRSAIGQMDAGDSLLKQAEAIQELPGGPTRDLAATLSRRGSLLEESGRYAEAEPLLRRSLSMYQNLVGPGQAELVQVERVLAQALGQEQQVPKAEALLRTALASLPRSEEPLRTELNSELGYTLFQQARYGEAVELLRPTLEEQRRIFGPLHNSTLATMRRMASALRGPASLPEAEALDREALVMTRALYGPDHFESAASNAALAVLLERAGNFAAADTFARTAVGQKIRHYGEASVEAALMLRTLGGIRIVLGDPAEAERLLRRALAAFHAAAPQGNLDEGDVLNRLAYLLILRRAPDADSLYRQAVRFERARLPADPFFVTDGYEYLGWAARERHDTALARLLYLRADSLYRSELPEGHPYRVQVVAGLRALDNATR